MQQQVLHYKIQEKYNKFTIKCQLVFILKFTFYMQPSGSKLYTCQ